MRRDNAQVRQICRNKVKYTLMVSKKKQPTRMQAWRAKLTLANVRRVFGVVAAITYLLAAVAVLWVGLLPVKYLLVVLLVSGIGMAVLLRAWWRNHASKAKNIALIVLAVIVTAISIGVLNAAVSLHGFFSGVQQADYRTETYSIVAKKDRKMTLDAAKTAALLGSDQNLNEVKEGMRQKTAAEPVTHDNLAAIITALDDHTADTAVLSAAYMNVLADNNSTVYAGLEVLATFTIRVKNTQTAAIDVTKPFVVYISGIDTYGEIGTVSRSDVNMLMVVNPQTHNVLLVNTPRDYYVQLHGTTGIKDKLTHAGLYGVDMSRQTLEDLYDVSIDAYVRVNFSSLVAIVDAVGGVDVYSDYAFKQFSEGQNHLDGRQALAFSRERYSFSEGDRQRGKNQQRVIEAIISKLNNPRNVLNYQAILGAVQGAVQTNIGQDNLARLANQQLDTLRPWKVYSISVDGTGASEATYSMGAQPLYVMVPDQASLDAAKRKIDDYLK